MVSKARLDLPDPDRPVITISELRGSLRWRSLRLCSRAPETTISPVPEAALRAVAPPFSSFSITRITSVELGQDRTRVRFAEVADLSRLCSYPSPGLWDNRSVEPEDREFMRQLLLRHEK